MSAMSTGRLFVQIAGVRLFTCVNNGPRLIGRVFPRTFVSKIHFAPHCPHWGR